MPLNEPLYRALALACKKGPPQGLAGGKVVIVNAGQPMTCAYTQDPFGKTGQQKQIVINHGESYKVCCPFCGDSRYRLWINHLYGVYDNATKKKNWHLIKCFNEDCTHRPNFFEDFKATIDTLTNSIQLQYQLKPMQTTVPQFDVAKPVDAPGVLTPLTELPSGHPAITFLQSRGHNPKRLTREFKVGWCEDSKFSQARHRIVVPILRNGLLMGWQARYVNPNGGGDCKGLYVCQNHMCQHQFKSETKPTSCPSCSVSDPPQPVKKWYTSPGAKVGQLMLNYDIAVAYPYAILCEGPMDVFRVGTATKPDIAGPAMAIFNHQLSKGHLDMLSRWRNTGPVFLLFDQDVFEKTVKQMKDLLPHFKYGVVPVMLPDNKDPGDLEHADLWDYIRLAAKEFEVKCEF